MRIAGQSEARRFYGEWQPSHVLSIVTPGRSYLGPRDVPPERHLILTFEDGDGETPGGASLSDIAAILDFAAKLPADAALLIHSLQGVNRAPAAALGILAVRLGPAEAVAALAPGCTQAPDPSPGLVALFDRHLGLSGELVTAAGNRFVAGSRTLRRRSAAGDDRFGGEFDMPDAVVVTEEPSRKRKRAAG